MGNYFMTVISRNTPKLPVYTHRSSRSQMFFEIAVLKSFALFTCVGVSMFLCEYYKIYTNSVFIGHRW